jgi:hypothetical protein
VLTDIPLQLAYRTGRDHLVKDFMVPCLEQAVLYRRSAGYFTSAGLGLAARGVASLAARGGLMRLVASPHLEPDDVEALQQGHERPEEALRRIAGRSLAEIEDVLVRDRLNALAWLAASGRLEIRLALRTDGSGGFSLGIFHEKSGVFSDAASNHVAFTGSSNETAGGLVENFESIDVYRSWCDSEGRVEQKIADFEALWQDRTPGLKVIDFTQAGRGLLEAFRDPEQPPPGMPLDFFREDPVPAVFGPPPGFVLREYQRNAIANWSKAGGKGILAMATGTGKTFTTSTSPAKSPRRILPSSSSSSAPSSTSADNGAGKWPPSASPPSPAAKDTNSGEPAWRKGTNASPQDSPKSTLEAHSKKAITTLWSPSKMTPVNILGVEIPRDRA